MTKIKLCELFGPTVEGEGKYIGVPFIVIRTSGCNLKCSFCDTRFSSHYDNDEQEYSKEEILNYIKNNPCKNVSITGGEPFFRSKEELDALYELCLDIKALHPTGILKIETNVTLIDEKFLDVIDFWSMSPKLKGMGEGLWFSKDIIKKIIAKSMNYQLKFVVGSRGKDGTMEEDLKVIKDLYDELNLKESLIILQPEGLTENLREYLVRGEMLVERVVNSNKIDWDFWQNVNLQILPQWHRLLWNNSRRK